MLVGDLGGVGGGEGGDHNKVFCMVLDCSGEVYACWRVKKYTPTVVNISGLRFLPFKTFFRY